MNGMERGVFEPISGAVFKGFTSFHTLQRRNKGAQQNTIIAVDVYNKHHSPKFKGMQSTGRGGE